MWWNERRNIFVHVYLDSMMSLKGVCTCLRFTENTYSTYDLAKQGDESFSNGCGTGPAPFFHCPSIAAGLKDQNDLLFSARRSRNLASGHMHRGCLLVPFHPSTILTQTQRAKK